MPENGDAGPVPPEGESVRATAKEDEVAALSLRRALQRSRFVLRCAQSLLLDTTVTATALLLCQQFYAQRSEAQFDHHVIGGACVFLATKSCEVPRTLRSIVNVVHAVMNDTMDPLGADVAYTNLKNSLINAEQTVLRALRFDVDVVLPHLYLFNYARHLNVEERTVRCALGLVNDVLCAPDAVRFPSPTLAASCLTVATHITEDSVGQSHGKWWHQFDTSDDDIEAVARVLEQIHEVTNAERTA